MREEIFGPVLAVYVYDDGEWEKVLELVDRTTPYALTGAIFGYDKTFLSTARRVLRHAAGNLYVNEKSTAAVVGQQPFGGARLSGTNDKAGAPHYVLKWTSPLTVKEARVAANPANMQWRYPYMD